MTQDSPLMLANRYEVRELVGRGGMAAVHMAYDTRLSRTVAVKLLRADLAHDPMFRERFRREAQSAAALNHPSIVAVYDTGEDPVAGSSSTMPYIVMEYVEGHTVHELLAGGDAVPLDEAVEITAGVLDALEYSHRMGIVHRDIKPGNIMITSRGTVKVMDFGIARALTDSAATMTEASNVVGTAQYLSPEQARGETVDARSDLYSTGCLLFELLTGQAPFRGDSAVAVAYQHVRETPPLPSSLASDVPETLDRVVMKALAKDRADRYPDAAAFRADLQAAGAGLPVAAPETQVWGVPGGVAAGAAAVGVPTAVMGSPEADPSTTLTGAGSARVLEEEKPRRWWIWPLVVLGLLALAAGAFLLTRGEEPPATVTVPELTGMDQTEARQAIEEAQLRFALGEAESSDSVPVGEFTSANPAPGTSVERDSTVEVHFSAGPDAVTVPDVTGMSQADARVALEEAGLRVGDVSTVDQPGREGYVLSTDPASGASVTADSTVALTVASGYVELPDLTGMSRDDAVATLSRLGLEYSVSEEESEVTAPGTVLRTDVPAGAVRVGSTVAVVVAREPEATPEPTREPTRAPTTPEPTEEPTSEAPTNPEPTEEPTSEAPTDPADAARQAPGAANRGPGNNAGVGNDA